MTKRSLLPSVLLFTLLLSLYAFKGDKPLQLFLLGDSISLQYGTYLEKYLAGRFSIERKGSQEKALQNLDVPVDANGGDSKMVLDYLRTRAKDPHFKPDLLLLNCGLHDIKRNIQTQELAVDPVSYRRNLEEIYKIVSEKKISMIWIRTTEVVDSLHASKSKAFRRYARDVQQYNTIADDVFTKHKIPVIDLYTFTKRSGKDRFADHVHYIPRVADAQARYIANIVKRWKPGAANRRSERTQP